MKDDPTPLIPASGVVRLKGAEEQKKDLASANMVNGRSIPDRTREKPVKHLLLVDDNAINLKVSFPRDPFLFAILLI